MIAGAAANPRTHLVMAALDWARQPERSGQLHSSGQISRDSPSRARRLRRIDGVKDGLDYRSHALPLRSEQVLFCKGTDAPSCLTAPQMESMTKIMTPVTNPRTGKRKFSPLVEPGTELGWGLLLAGTEPFV